MSLTSPYTDRFPLLYFIGNDTLVDTAGSWTQIGTFEFDWPGAHVSLIDDQRTKYDFQIFGTMASMISDQVLRFGRPLVNFRIYDLTNAAALMNYFNEAGPYDQPLRRGPINWPTGNARIIAQYKSNDAANYASFLFQGLSFDALRLM